MNISEHLLTCLIEECSEVQKLVCKGLRFGMKDNFPGRESNNTQDLLAEITDLHAVIEMLVDNGILPNNGRDERGIALKKQKVHKYMEYAIKSGTLGRPPCNYCKDTGWIDNVKRSGTSVTIRQVRCPKGCTPPTQIL